MNPRLVEQPEMPEANNIMRTYIEFLSFLTQIRRLKTSVTPDVINEKHGLTDIGKGTEFNRENGSGVGFKELSEKNEKYKLPIELSSSGKEAGVSIDIGE
ncbi:hypothetical protein AVEN_78004-1 [Araneus ventricosus]|uniref:Uncharacterized protein n=2 Tax=Araneus ventricosus TaxID=182803 RepID=A0A4Y2NBA7_ARAVE|nr:hypothetical protein AVEN_39853-1 [Araneus ventricosus]GBN36272.1 hypothetical protein AVEN_78004-1 [Araneus ventricosus]